MRVVDGTEVEVGVVDLQLDPVLLGAVDLVAKGTRGRVRGAVHLDRLPVAGSDHPAALVRSLPAGMIDHLLEELPAEVHRGRGYLVASAANRLRSPREG